jgi:hypothetical protein
MESSMQIRFVALPTDIVRHYQAGGLDSYNLHPERRISDGDGVPCRHCLRNVAAGEPFLVLAHRPFSKLQPFAETGPIFLHAEPCDQALSTDAFPEILDSPNYILRGYDADERIVYGSGGVVDMAAIKARAEDLLNRDTIHFVDVRSSRNNCFQCRIVAA